MESEEKTNVTWNNLFSKSHNDGSFSLCPVKRVAASCKGQRVSGGVGGGSGVGNTGLDSADCKKT